jgi:signal-transduction protein with cAMP-binding, CBS, and nucleotidyltransferase domain
MVEFLRNLEVRQFLPGEEILGTLDSVDEMYFISSGTYDVGFEFNNVKKFRLKFGERTIIGGFGLAFNKRT